MDRVPKITASKKYPLKLEKVPKKISKGKLGP